MKRPSVKQWIAMLLCIIILLDLLPLRPLGAQSEDTTLYVSNGVHTADAGTLNGWTSFLDTDQIPVSHANRVWTDKSVFTSADEYWSMHTGTDDRNEEVLSINDRNFLVSLSAMATNTQITGYMGNPTDTVLILDLSQSMDNSKYIPTLINATNSALSELQKQNLHNRVSVVLYSGNSSTNESANLSNATTLLPLDRYTAGAEEKYITYTGSNSDTTVTVASSVKNSAGETVSGSKQTVGGTYIQSGLYLASRQFEAAYRDGTTVIDKDMIQGGVKRIPVITLMSDGLPTIATNEYCTFERSATTGRYPNQTTVYGVTNQGNGGSNTNAITFLTQLTAKWLKTSVRNWYDNDALFYTVWVKSASDTSDNATLKPETSNDVLDGWWKTFLRTESGNITFEDDQTEFSVTRDDVIGTVPAVSPETDEYTKAWQAEQNYVDAAFSATNITDFTKAFEDIVNTIHAQSMHYPTFITTSNANADGYITLEDPLGDFMEVKNVKGLHFGDTLFRENGLTDLLQSAATPIATFLADQTELVQSVQKRMNVDQSTAVSAIVNAWNCGHVGYNDSTKQYSNYIGWYTDAQGNFAGLYNAQTTPDTAKELVKSYIYYNRIDIAASGTPQQNLMHLFVDVITDLSSNHQRIRVSIPAALIPQLIYKINLNASSLDTATTATYSITGAQKPIRVLAEVGLWEDVNQLTVKTMMQEAGYPYRDENGTYRFYTNRWNSDTAATVYFHPSPDNPSYYYNSKTTVYSDTQGTRYDNTVKPENGTYYRAVYTLNVTQSGTATVQRSFEPISAYAISFAEKNAADDQWCIPEGTMLGDLESNSVAKSDNVTQTHSFVSKRNVSRQNDYIYDVYELLGNNGLVTLQEPTGLKLTKKLTETAPDTDIDAFILQVTLTGSSLAETVKVSYDQSTFVTMDTDNIRLSLRAGQSVWLYDLPAGASYTITEADHAGYVPVKTVVSGSLTEHTVIPVDFYNRPVYTGGVQVIQKTEHPFGEEETVPDSLTFTYTAQVKRPDGTPMADATVYTSKGELLSDQNGTISFTLPPNGSFTVENLPDGSTVTTTQTKRPAGFTVDTETQSSTVVNGQLMQQIFTNTYSPASLTNADVEITGNKTLKGRQWQEFDRYVFSLQYLNGDRWETLGTDVVTANDTAFSFSEAMRGFTFDHKGEYKFRILEEAGELGGVSYDSEPRIFTVSVQDTWDGGYTLAGVTHTDPRINVTAATQDGRTVYAVETNFVNQYAAASCFTDIQGQKQLIGDVLTHYTGQNAFQFDLYTAVKDQQGGLIKDQFVISAFADTNGAFLFDHKTVSLLQFETAGTYHFILNEADTTDPFVVTDTRLYELTVEVTDDLNGNLTPTITVIQVEETGTRTAISKDDILFVNTVRPVPVSITLSGEKQYSEPLAAGAFSFRLQQATLNDTVYTPVGEPLIVSHDETGNFTFAGSLLQFHDTGTYHFIVTEVTPDGVTADAKEKEGILYDTSVYTVTVTVTQQTNDVGKSVLTCQTLINGDANQKLVFINSKIQPPPAQPPSENDPETPPETTPDDTLPETPPADDKNEGGGTPAPGTGEQGARVPGLAILASFALAGLFLTSSKKKMPVQ